MVRSQLFHAGLDREILAFTMPVRHLTSKLRINCMCADRTTGSSAPASGYPIRPFSPVSRLEEVDERIKEYIAKNELRPGDRLPGESWFASQLGVGRPLVREAMKGLEAVGVIEARKGVGRFVRA